MLALAKSAGEAALPYLLPALNNPIGASQVIRALGYIQSQKVVNILLDKLRDHEAIFAKEVILALSWMPFPEVLPTLIQAINPDEMNNEVIKDGLLRFGRAAIPHLIQVMKEHPQDDLENGEYRLFSAEVLSELDVDDPYAIHELIALYENETVNTVRILLLRAIGKTRNKSVLPLLADALKDTDKYVRIGGVEASVNFIETDVNIVDLLQNMLNDSDEDVIKTIKKVLSTPNH